MGNKLIAIFFCCTSFSWFCNQKLVDDRELSSFYIQENPIESTQKIISSPKSKNATIGQLYGMELINGAWEVTFDTIPCSFGYNGFADLGKKKEGDGKTPSGTFPLGSSFGYERDLETDMDFIRLNENHFWVSDTMSEQYNRLVEHNPDDLYSEKMRRNDHLYKYGIIIEYNTQEVIKGKGSAIFIHVERRKGQPTSGCIAVSEGSMKELIKWIKPHKKPLIIMGEM